jgi:7tm Odorant receptor
MFFLSEGPARITYQFQFFYTLAAIYVYSLCGNLVVDSSTEISKTLYKLEWYVYDIKNQKSVLMIMIRSQRKVKINVLFFDASVETFVSVSFVIAVDEEILKFIHF